MNLKITLLHTRYDMMIFYRLQRLIKASKIIHTDIKRQTVSHDDLKKDYVEDSRIQGYIAHNM